MYNTITIIIIAAIGLLIIILLMLKNKKDKKLINPDAEDSIEETMMDQERRKDKV